MSHRIFDLPDDICEQLTTLYLRPESEALLYATNHNYPPRKLGGERGSALLASMLLNFYYDGEFLSLQDNQTELLSRIAEDGKIRITPLPVPKPCSGTKSDYWAAAESAVFHVLEMHKEASDQLELKGPGLYRDKWDLKSLALTGDDASNQNNHTILTKQNEDYFPLDRRGYFNISIKHLCLHNLKLWLQKEEALIIKRCLCEDLCLVHLRLRLSEQSRLGLYGCDKLKRFVFSQHPDDEGAAAWDDYTLEIDDCRNLRRVEASAALPRTSVDLTLRVPTLRVIDSGKRGRGLDIYAAGSWGVSVKRCYAKVLSLYCLKDRGPMTHLGLRVDECSGLEQVSLPCDLNLVEGTLKFRRCGQLAKIGLPDQLRCQKADLLFHNLDSLSELSHPALWEIAGDGYRAKFESCNKLETIGLPTYLVCQTASVEVHTLHELREIVLPASFGPADNLGGSAVKDSCLRLQVESCPRLQSICTARAPATKSRQQRRPDLIEISVSRFSVAHEEVKGAADLKILAAGVSMVIEVSNDSDIKTLVLSPDQKKMKGLKLEIANCDLLEQVCLSKELTCKRTNLSSPSSLCVEPGWVSQEKFDVFIWACEKLHNFILPQLLCKEAELRLLNLDNLQSLCLESANWRVSRLLKLLTWDCDKLETIHLPKNIWCKKAEFLFKELPLLQDFSMPQGWDIEELTVIFAQCPNLQSFTVPPGFKCRRKFTLDFSWNINMPTLNLPKLSGPTKWCKRLVVRRPKR